jgi:hypothetical protein
VVGLRAYGVLRASRPTSQFLTKQERGRPAMPGVRLDWNSSLMAACPQATDVNQRKDPDGDVFRCAT